MISVFNIEDVAKVAAYEEIISTGKFNEKNPVFYETREKVNIVAKLVFIILDSIFSLSEEYKSLSVKQLEKITLVATSVGAVKNTFSGWLLGCGNNEKKISEIKTILKSNNLFVPDDSYIREYLNSTYVFDRNKQ